MQKKKHGKQKQREQHAGVAEAEEAACKGSRSEGETCRDSRSRRSSMQGKQKQKEQHAGVAEAEGAACRGRRSRSSNMQG